MLGKLFDLLSDEGVLGLFRRAGDRLRHSKAAFQMYKLGLLDHDTIYGPEYYEKMDRESAIRDAARFAELVLARYDVESVIELGCGTGRLLYPYYEEGIRVHGVDLSGVAREVSRLPHRCFEIGDLREPYTPDRRCDLALCVEVLEHIPAEDVDVVVGSLSRCSKLVIISAAPPGQGGTHHVNEQPVGYWIRTFKEAGMIYDSKASDWFNSRLELEDLEWISESLLVFQATSGMIDDGL